MVQQTYRRTPVSTSQYDLGRTGHTSPVLATRTMMQPCVTYSPVRPHADCSCGRVSVLLASSPHNFFQLKSPRFLNDDATFAQFAFWFLLRLSSRPLSPVELGYVGCLVDAAP